MVFLFFEELNMIFRTECAWCGDFMHEEKCSDTKHCQSLAKKGIITSHSICNKCKEVVEIEYKARLKLRDEQVGCFG